MNSKKHTVIISSILFSLILMGFGIFYQVFYNTSASAVVSEDASNETEKIITTATVSDPSSNPNGYVSTKSLYYIYMSSKWSRMKRNEPTDYLTTQYIALNTSGLNINRYPSNQIGTTKAATPLKTGPGITYSTVVQLPQKKSLELIGDIVNPAGEKWLMYKYAYAIYYVASNDIEISVPLTTPIISTSTLKPKTTTPPAPTAPPISTPTTTTENAQKIVALAYSKLGFAYVYGASGPNSFDCSGFVYWVVNNSGIPGLSVPRTSQALYQQYQSYNIGTNIADAHPGDIILFSKDGRIAHSAIYYKDSKMIHASEPSTGVILTTVAYSTSNKSVFAIIRLPGV